MMLSTLTIISRSIDAFMLDTRIESLEQIVRRGGLIG